MKTITPNLWFDGYAEEAAEFYRGFGNIGTESPVKPSSATIAALYELFLVSNRIAQWPQFAPRYGFGHRE